MKAECFSCHHAFECGIDRPNLPCWCSKKPKVVIDSNQPSCLCESCLRQKAPSVDKCFRMKLAYIGTKYSGFQMQANGRSVEGELTNALKRIVNSDVNIKAAGRTDAGVHAHGQIVSLHCKTHLSPRQLCFALTTKLPSDMAVVAIDEMPLGFNAQRHSVGKRYIYRIQQGIVADPFLHDRSLHVRHDLDESAMHEAAQAFVGEHDFSSFRSSHCTARHARRYVWHVSVEKRKNIIEVDVRGNAFCMNMVRIMVGSLIEIGQGRRPKNSIQLALETQNRRLAGITAKPHGLTLDRVYYPDDLRDAGIIEGAIFPRYPVPEELLQFFPKAGERSGI